MNPTSSLNLQIRLLDFNPELLSIKVDDCIKISELKKDIWQRTKAYKQEQMQLMFKGQVLEDSKTLE